MVDKTTEVQRVLRVPVLRVPDEQWIALRRLAYQAGIFGNHLLSESYLKAKGFEPQGRVYTEQKEGLSSLIRDAVSRECVGIWRRLGKKILRGEQTLGRFSADRALVIRGRGISIGLDDHARMAIRFRFFPRPEPITSLTVFPPALSKKNNLYLRETLEFLKSNPTITSNGKSRERIGKAAIIFERPGRKISLSLAYSKEIAPQDPAMVTAQLFVLSDGTCRLSGQQRTLTLTSEIYRLVATKEHFARIHGRLRINLGKAHRPREFRRTMLKAGNFETWAIGPVHNLSRQIVDWCQENGVGNLLWKIDPGAPALPWHTLQKQVQYKGEEVGLVTQVTRMEE